jgi:hypothetical protein
MESTPVRQEVYIVVYQARMFLSKQIRTIIFTFPVTTIPFWSGLSILLSSVNYRGFVNMPNCPPHPEGISHPS